MWEEVFFRNDDILHHNGASVGGPQGEFTLNLGAGQARCAGVDEETSDLVVVYVRLGPHQNHVGDGGVGDPGGGW